MTRNIALKVVEADKHLHVSNLYRVTARLSINAERETAPPQLIFKKCSDIHGHKSRHRILQPVFWRNETAPGVRDCPAYFIATRSVRLDKTTGRAQRDLNREHNRKLSPSILCRSSY